MDQSFCHESVSALTRDAGGQRQDRLCASVALVFAVCSRHWHDTIIILSDSNITIVNIIVALTVLGDVQHVASFKSLGWPFCHTLNPKYYKIGKLQLLETKSSTSVC